MKKWGTIIVVGIVAYLGWRKFGGSVRSGVTNVLS